MENIKILLLDKDFFQRILDGDLFNDSSLNIDGGMVLVSFVDISVLESSFFDINKFKDVLCSSKYQRLTKRNWKKKLRFYLGNGECFFEEYSNICDFNEYKLLNYRKK